jgi:hypothetical protein
MKITSWLCVLFVVVVACGGQVAGEGAPAPGECTTSADCDKGSICGFPVSDSCTAKGSCFERGPMCNGFAPGCACDGSTINVMCTGLPGGEGLAPLRHLGACE